MTGRAYFRCRCGRTTLYAEPGESMSGECPTCGPMFAVPNDGGGEDEPTIEDYRRALAAVIDGAFLDFGRYDDGQGYLGYAAGDFGTIIYDPTTVDLLERVWPKDDAP